MSNEEIEYLEPTRRARVLGMCLLAVVGLLGVASFVVPEWIVETSRQYVESVDRLLLPALVNAAWSTAIYFLICAVAVWIAFRAVKTRQWPPKGIVTPVRKRIVRIDRPGKVWLVLGLFLVVFSVQPAIAWYSYHDLKGKIDPAPGFAKSPPPDEVMRFEERVETYLQAEKRGDFKTMYRLRDTDFRNSIDQSNFTEILVGCCDGGLVTEYEIQGIAFRPENEAVVWARIMEPLGEELADGLGSRQVPTNIEMRWELETDGWRCADAGARTYGRLRTALTP